MLSLAIAFAAIGNVQAWRLYRKLPDPNPMLLPVHDIRIDNITDRTITGHFYLGGVWDPVAGWPFGEPVIYMDDYHNGFDPEGRWRAAPYSMPLRPIVGDPAVDKEEGSRVEFQVVAPGVVADPSKFWIAVQVRGESLEGIDEISFAAQRRPEEACPGTDRTDTITPITWHRPVAEFLPPSETHYIYTNKDGRDLDYCSLYYLKTKQALPALGMAWAALTKDEHGAGFDKKASPYSARKHRIFFNKGHAKHYMAATCAPSTDPSGLSYSEWSGVIRPSESK